MLEGFKYVMAKSTCTMAMIAEEQVVGNNRHSTYQDS